MPRMARTMARTALVAGTATSVSNRVSKRQHGRWAEQAQQQDNQAAAPPQPSVPPPPAPPAQPAPPADMSSKLAQLQQLGELRAQGILTEEEFAAQKDKILAG